MTHQLTFVVAVAAFAIALPSSASAAPPVTGGLVLHLDGDDVNGDGSNPANGALIDTWADTSGLGNDALGVGGLRPTYSASALNGHGGVSFTSDRLATAVSSDFDFTEATIVLVTTPGDRTAVSVAQSGSNNEEFSVWHAFNRGVFHHTSDFNSTRVTDATTTDPYIQMGIFGNTPTDLANIIDGVDAVGSIFTDGSPANFTAVNRVAYIGDRGSGSQRTTATIAEVLIYERKLTQEEQNLVGAYLADKYAITTAWVVPAPAALPAGLLMLSAVATRRRRRPNR